MHPAALLTVIGTICYALYSISTRVLSTTDSSGTTLFYSGLFGAVVMSLVVPFVWSWPAGPLQVVVMIIMGTCGAFGHYLLILAHRLAPASILAPFIYTQMIWVVISGYLVFNDSAQSLDADRRRRCDRVRPLSALPRTQGARRSGTGGVDGTAAIDTLG